MSSNIVDRLPQADTHTLYDFITDDDINDDDVDDVGEEWSVCVSLQQY